MKTLLRVSILFCFICCAATFQAQAQYFIVSVPKEVCAPATVDLTAPSVTAGSDAGLNFSYWRDQAATVPLDNPSAVSETNIFYIKATLPGSSWEQTLPVCVTIGTNPDLVISPDNGVCAPALVDLTARVAGYGQDPTLSYYFYYDAALSKPVANPRAVNVSSSTIFYLQGIYTCSCNTTVQIPVTVNQGPSFTVADPAAQCAPAKISLWPTITCAPNSGNVYTFYRDSLLQQRIWQADSIATSGTYYIVGISPNGCTLVKHVQVTINQAPDLSLTNPAPLCAPATINLASAIGNYQAQVQAGITFSYFSDAALTKPLTSPDSIKTSGTYYVRASSKAGCWTSGSVSVVINPGPQLSVTSPAPSCMAAAISLKSTIASYPMAGLTYSFFSDAALTQPVTSPDSVRTSGTYYIKASNASGCSTVASVNLSFLLAPSLTVSDPGPACAQTGINLSSTITGYPASGISYSYFTDAGLKNFVTRPDSVTTTGTYYIAATSAAGCQAVKAVHVAISPGAQLSVVDPAQVCAGTPFDLTASIQNPATTGAITYSYFSDQALTIQVASPKSVVFPGTYYVVAKSTGGCQVVKPVHLTNSPAPSFALTDPTPICSGGSFDLSAAVKGQPVTGLDFTYFTDQALKMQVPNPKAVSVAGTYYVVAKNPGGCQSVQPVHLVFAAPPALTVSDPSPLCGVTSYNLASSIQNAGSPSGITYSWYSDAALTIPVSNPAAVSVSGTYYVAARNPAGCQTVQPVHLVFSQTTPLSVSQPAPVCAGETVNLTTLITNPSAGISYSYYSDASLQTKVSDPAQVSQSGTYYITASSAQSCLSVAQVKVVINNAPVLKLTSPNSGMSASADLTAPTVTAGSDAGLVYQYFMDQAQTMPVSQPNNVSQSGTYYVRATNPATGCHTSGSVSLVLNVSTLYIPTLFTPNGDGINDNFVIKGIEAYPDNTLEVFNRWGNRVYQASGYGIDGKLWNGSGLLEGTYYYVLKVRTAGSAQTRSHWVMILLKPLR